VYISLLGRSLGTGFVKWFKGKISYGWACI